MPQYENSPQKTADWEGIVWLINYKWNKCCYLPWFIYNTVVFGN